MEISVIIPTYNRAHLIGQTIDSVLNQVRPPDEIIVVDDGSTDDTAEIVSSYDSRVRYIRQANCGSPGAVRNKGAAEAKGDCIAFIDSDDLWLPDKLEKQMALLEASPELAMVWAYSEGIDDVGNKIPDNIWGTIPDQILGRRVPEDNFLALLAVNFMASHTPVIRSTAFADAGGFDPAVLYSEDHDLWLRISRTHKIDCINEVLAYHRVHNGNYSADMRLFVHYLVEVVRRNRPDEHCSKLHKNWYAISLKMARRRAAEALITHAYKAATTQIDSFSCLSRAMGYDPLFCSRNSHIYKNWIKLAVRILLKRSEANSG